MSNYDWSKFTQKISINASVSQIYDAWTIPVQLERWFLRSASFKRTDGTDKEAFLHIVKGDKYSWLWHGHADDVVEKGEVLIANETDKLQFSFVAGGIVTVDIGEAFGETIVMLTQENIPTDEQGRISYHMGCKIGWAFFLVNLKSVLEGGPDLRNKNPAITNVVNS